MAISKPFAYNPIFSIGTGFGNSVNSTAIQSDGKILVGGTFTTFTGSSQNSLIRLNSDGSKDTTFNIGSGFGNTVTSTVVQSDGKILVGGSFTTFTGSTQNRLIRLNSDGSKDTTFNIGTGFDSAGFIKSIAIQSDGKILAGGYLTTFTGSSQNMLIRLNSDGSKDTSFDIGTGFNSSVFSMAIQSDGKVLVGGEFTTFTGTTQNRLIRLNSDGSKDTSFDIGTGFGNRVQSISIQSDGKVLVGGDFTTFTGSTQNNLIRLNSDGSKDSSFNIGSGFFGGSVISTAIQSDGKILVGGLFYQYSGSTQNRLIRLNSDGSKDTTFNIGTGFDNSVFSMAIQPNKRILVGGSFTAFTGSTQNYLIRLNSDGSSAMGSAISGTTQYGDFVIGNVNANYGANYGGVKWWGGPDEELGYVIGNARPGGQPVPVGVTGSAYVGFWRSGALTDQSFLNLANHIGAQNSQPTFTTTSGAVTWLNANGYYTSYVL